MIKKSEDAQENYLATVIECPELETHPNPKVERLQIVSIFGGKVIVGKGSYTQGEKLVYFPIESSINVEFLGWANLLDDPDLNQDGTSKGFFSPKGSRVKPIKLQGVPSEGFLYPVSKLAEYYNVDPKVFKVGESFDMVGDKVLLKKWVSGAVQTQVERKVKLPKWLEVMPRPVRKYIGSRFYNRKDEGMKSMIVPGQFQFHYDTNNLGKSYFVLSPDDDITISDKWHGTSAVVGNILCYKTRKWWQKLLNVAPHRLDKEYRLVYSSRSVIKNRKDGKWTDDVWGQWAKHIDDKAIPPGFTIYSEIVGYVNHGKMVQKNYDYSCLPGNSDFMVYRITLTLPNGEVYEYRFDEIIQFCARFGLRHVPVFYQGKAKDLFPELEINDDWGKNFVNKLTEKYLEKDCQFCKNKVPSEGVVVKIDSKDHRPVFKHKSHKFKMAESADRDKGESNIEEES